MTGRLETSHPFKKGENEGPENYQSINLTSVLGMIMDPLLLEALSRYMEDGGD